MKGRKLRFWCRVDCYASANRNNMLAYQRNLVLYLKLLTFLSILTVMFFTVYTIRKVKGMDMGPWCIAAIYMIAIF